MLSCTACLPHALAQPLTWQRACVTQRGSHLVFESLEARLRRVQLRTNPASLSPRRHTRMHDASCWARTACFATNVTQQAYFKRLKAPPLPDTASPPCLARLSRLWSRATRSLSRGHVRTGTGQGGAGGRCGREVRRGCWGRRRPGGPRGW
eukprot:1751715-Rhodomonas_salina.1